jgi:tRNA A37 threonylcarbamoyladenosine modification protein TsaB
MSPTEFKVNTNVATSDFMAITTLNNNTGFVITYTDNSGSNVYAQIFSENGTKMSPAEFKVNTNVSTSSYMAITTLNNNIGFVITYTDSSVSNVYAQIFSENGTKISPAEFKVNTNVATYDFMAITTLNSNAGFVITFTDHTFSNVYAQIM